MQRRRCDPCRCMPFREYHSVYAPEELTQLAGVLAEALRACMGDNDKDIAGTEFDEIQKVLARIILEKYKAGERDLEKLRAIALDRARYFGYCVEVA